METLGGHPSERTGSETISTFPVAGTVFSASLSAALLAFLTITLFMNDEFLTIFFLPNLLDALNFPFFGGVLLLITVYKFRGKQKSLLSSAQIVNIIMFSIFGLMLIYISGIYMEPWMSSIGQFYQMFPVFLGILLMTQMWTVGVHFITLGGYLSTPKNAKNHQKIFGVFSGLTLFLINAFFWTFTQANILGLGVITLALGVVGTSIWILKDHTYQDWKIQMNSDLAPRFIKILLVITMIYVVVYYSLSQLNQYFKLLLGFPAYLGIVFIAHRSPEKVTSPREITPPGIANELKIHLKQSSLNTWSIGCFSFANLVLSYGCPPLRFLGPFILFFSIGLIAALFLLGNIKTRSQHIYAQFYCGFAILVLQIIFMYVDNVINGYNYYSAEILEIWPFTYLGSPWHGILAGISFAFLFDVLYSRRRPLGNTLDFSINTVGWALLLFYAIGLAVLLPNYNLLTYGGDVSLVIGPAPEMNAELFSDITVFLYQLGIPVLLVIFFLLFSISHWRSQRTLHLRRMNKEGNGAGGEVR